MEAFEDLKMDSHGDADMALMLNARDDMNLQHISPAKLRRMKASNTSLINKLCREELNVVGSMHDKEFKGNEGSESLALSVQTVCQDLVRSRGTMLFCCQLVFAIMSYKSKDVREDNKVWHAITHQSTSIIDMTQSVFRKAVQYFGYLLRLRDAIAFCIEHSSLMRMSREVKEFQHFAKSCHSEVKQLDETCMTGIKECLENTIGSHSIDFAELKRLRIEYERKVQWYLKRKEYLSEKKSKATAAFDRKLHVSREFQYAIGREERIIERLTAQLKRLKCDNCRSCRSTGCCCPWLDDSQKREANQLMGEISGAQKILRIRQRQLDNRSREMEEIKRQRREAAKVFEDMEREALRTVTRVKSQLKFHYRAIREACAKTRVKASELGDFLDLLNSLAPCANEMASKMLQFNSQIGHMEKMLSKKFAEENEPNLQDLMTGPLLPFGECLKQAQISSLKQFQCESRQDFEKKFMALCKECAKKEGIKLTLGLKRKLRKIAMHDDLQKFQKESDIRFVVQSLTPLPTFFDRMYEGLSHSCEQLRIEVTVGNRPIKQ